MKKILIIIVVQLFLFCNIGLQDGFAIALVRNADDLPEIVDDVKRYGVPQHKSKLENHSSVEQIDEGINLRGGKGEKGVNKWILGLLLGGVGISLVGVVLGVVFIFVFIEIFFVGTIIVGISLLSGVASLVGIGAMLYYNRKKDDVEKPESSSKIGQQRLRRRTTTTTDKLSSDLIEVSTVNTKEEEERLRKQKEEAERLRKQKEEERLRKQKEEAERLRKQKEEEKSITKYEVNIVWGNEQKILKYPTIEEKVFQLDKKGIEAIINESGFFNFVKTKTNVNFVVGDNPQCCLTFIGTGKEKRVYRCDISNKDNSKTVQLKFAVLKCSYDCSKDVNSFLANLERVGILQQKFVAPYWLAGFKFERPIVLGNFVSRRQLEDFTVTEQLYVDKFSLHGYLAALFINIDTRKVWFHDDLNTTNLFYYPKGKTIADKFKIIDYDLVLPLNTFQQTTLKKFILIHIMEGAHTRLIDFNLYLTQHPTLLKNTVLGFLTGILSGVLRGNSNIEKKLYIFIDAFIEVDDQKKIPVSMAKLFLDKLKEEKPELYTKINNYYNKKIEYSS